MRTEHACRLAGMVLIPSGNFTMGSDRHYPEERPPHPRQVREFWLSRTPVTNSQFSEFVEATGYLTDCERPVTEAKVTRGLAGSAVFRMPLDAVDTRRVTWWHFVEGANWRCPEGPGSTIEGRETHPVVHVSHRDAAEYARWAAMRLPTEAEWEFAARGGAATVFPWGEELRPGGVHMANIWWGEFPWHNRKLCAPSTEPVGLYPPNGYGLVDLIGNVWEWTADPWTSVHGEHSGCCGEAPRHEQARRFVTKGGSFLCAESYCERYRPTARMSVNEDEAAAHIGFRCAFDTTQIEEFE